MSNRRRNPGGGHRSPGKYRAMGRYHSVSWWDRLPPGVRAGLIMMLPVLLIQLLNAFAFQLEIVAIYAVQLILYIVNGFLAANFFLNRVGGRAGRGGIRRNRVSGEMNREAITAGLVLGIFAVIIYALIAAFWGQIIFGVGTWSGLVALLICGPIDIIVSIMVAMLGAWLYDRVFA